MRSSVAMAATVLVALGVVAIAVYGAGDRSLFVPVPEAVAESFARQIAARRYELARHFLSHDCARRETTETLRARFEPLLARAGKVSQVDADAEWFRGQRSAARAHIDGDAAMVSFGMELVPEQGLWKIDLFSDGAIGSIRH